MKNSFAFILITAITLHINSMENSELKQKIKKTIEVAFQAFGIKASNFSIETQSECLYSNCCRNPDKKLKQWEGGEKCIWLTHTIQNNSYLTEFAACCIAASVKNKNCPKSIYTFYAAMGASLILAGLPLVWTVGQIGNATLYSTYILGKLIASGIPLGFLVITNTIPHILDDAFTDYLDAQAFTLACQKLIEQKNFKPLTTYYAYAKLVKHRPLCQKKQAYIIERELKNKNFSLTCAYNNYNSIRCHIWKEGICMGNGEYSLPLLKNPFEVNFADFDTSAKLEIPRFNA